MIARLAVILALILASSSAMAEDVMLPGEQEAEAQALMREIRCMVCSGESILDSGAPMARDMRVFVREQIAEGADAEGVRQALVERFGHEVLLRPPMEGRTAPLWIAPVAFVLLGGVLLFTAMRRTSRKKS
ncbi:MAG: cytochrome c-type biogenesis protein [Pseudomonadota bacterium]